MGEEVILDTDSLQDGDWVCAEWTWGV